MFYYYMEALRKYAVFDGRASRREFWTFALGKGLESTTYTFLKPGILFIKSMEGAQGTIAVSVATEDFVWSDAMDAPKLKKGELVFTYLTPEYKPYLELFLRKLN
jgi:hypothetical protein